MRFHWTFLGCPLWLAVAGLYLLPCPLATAIGQQVSNKPVGTDQDATSQFITLTIDYGDGFQKRFVEIAWHDGMNILDALQTAKKYKRARFDFTFQGQGATALLSKIDDLASEGGGQRNWIFYVNQRKGDRSFGIWKLHPGDEVLWRFEKYL